MTTQAAGTQAGSHPTRELPEAAISIAPGRKWLWKLMAAGLVTAVVGGECIFAFIYVTSAASRAATAEPDSSQSEPAATLEQDKQLAIPGEPAKPVETAETDLGEFSLTAFQPTSNTTLLIDFHLFGEIPRDAEAAFAELYGANKHRIREQVITTVRSAELADLVDPGLGLIKRQILEKSNRTLGKPLLQAIIVSDFLIVEQ